MHQQNHEEENKRGTSFNSGATAENVMIAIFPRLNDFRELRGKLEDLLGRKLDAGGVGHL